MPPSEGYVDKDYLKTAARLFGPIKRRSYDKLRIDAATRLIDVGCGPGLDVISMARLLRHEGEVVGLDSDTQMLAEALRHASDAGLASRVRFETGNACDLPFADNLFDGCRSERLFMHLARPEQALSEMVRILRPGGMLVATETDWATLSCDCDTVETERRLCRFRAETCLRNGYSARTLLRQFKTAGLIDIDLEIFPLHTIDLELFRYLTMQAQVEYQALEAGVLSEEALAAWHRDQEARAERDVFFGSVNVLMASGRKG